MSSPLCHTAALAWPNSTNGTLVLHPLVDLALKQKSKGMESLTKRVCAEQTNALKNVFVLNRHDLL
jgi:hypothetical protein